MTPGRINLLTLLMLWARIGAIHQNYARRWLLGIDAAPPP